MQQKTLILGIVGLLIIAAGAWFLFGNATTGQQDEATEPSAVVARVNGAEITQVELESSMAQISAQLGVDPTSLNEEGRAQIQGQALDALIGNILIRQAVSASGLSATETDIDSRLNAIKGQFPDDAQYQEALSAQGLTEASLRDQIAQEVATQMYLEQTLDLASVTVSEEEIAALYEQESEVSEEEVPPLEEVRGQIEAFVTQQKQQALLATHIQELRATANIEVLI